MKTETRSMFDSSGNRVQLADVLSEIETSNLNWSILDFNGIGKAPNGLSMDEFEDAIRSDNSGFKMTWEELKEFSKSLEQTIDCLIVAVSYDAVFDGVELAQNDFSSCEIVIQAFDSTEWQIKKR